MVKKRNRKVALVSIRPVYVQQILDGTKKVELRKSFSQEITHIVIYSTAPESTIVGWFEINKIENISPKNIWNKYKHIAGITYDDFFDYFEDRELGNVIHIGKVKRYKTQKLLSDFDFIKTAPQSFQYIPEEVLYRLGIPA
jgi:predicted transcriptional regulator